MYNLPRVILDIKKEELKELSEELNKEFYAELKHTKKKKRDTLNNIRVADINDMCFCKGNKQCKKPMFEKILGKTAPYQDDIMCYGNCLHTVFAAAKRQLKAAPTPDPKILKEFLKFSEKWIENCIGEDLNTFSYSFADWYNHLTHQKQLNMDKVIQYLNPKYNLMLKPKERQKLKSAHYEGICKIELQKSDGKPRMVCSIPDIIKYTMGPVTWQLEEICSEKFKGYCGGMNLTEMADKINEYIDFGFTKVVEGDGSAFDNTQDVTLKEVDRYIYRRIKDKIYHVPLDLYEKYSQAYYKTMDIMYRNPGEKKNRKMMTYSVLGTVFSGDCDTTLSNTIRMALYNIFANESAGLKYDKDFVVFSKGDDFSVLYKHYVSNEKIQQIYNDYFLKASTTPEIADTRIYGLGQVCKFLDIGQPNSFKFCSLRSWYCDEFGHVILTRDPAKLFNLSKYSRKTKTYDIPQLISFLFDQAIALKASYQGIHIFDTAAACYIKEAHRLMKQLNKKQIARLERIMKYGRKAESRQHIDIEDPINEIDPKVLNINHRNKQYYIQGTYWETMKRIEKINVRRYTSEQLVHINNQIDAEFSSDELRAMLAQKI
jgi:hypothetical protein